MLDPRKWERVDQARLFFAVAFGALLGFTSGLDRSGGSLAGLEACGSTLCPHRRSPCWRVLLLL